MLLKSQYITETLSRSDGLANVRQARVASSEYLNHKYTKYTMRPLEVGAVCGAM